MLKNLAFRPLPLIVFKISSTLGSVPFLSRCTPKMFIPQSASSMLMASPNPLDAPKISAQVFSKLLVSINFSPPIKLVEGIDR